MASIQISPTDAPAKSASVETKTPSKDHAADVPSAASPASVALSKQFEDALLKNMENCVHETVEAGTCMECGLLISGASFLSHDEEYSNSHQRSTNAAPLGFEKELKDKNIPERVKTWVLENNILAPKRIHRMKNREYMLLANVYLGYIALGYDIQPEKIAENLGISYTRWNKALKLSSGTSSVPLPQNSSNTIIASVVVISPVSYIEERVKILEPIVNNIVEHIPNIKKCMEEALKTDQLLYEEKPTWVAIGMLKAYLDYYKVVVPSFYTHFNTPINSGSISTKQIKKVPRPTIEGCVARINQALKWV